MQKINAEAAIPKTKNPGRLTVCRGLGPLARRPGCDELHRDLPVDGRINLMARHIAKARAGKSAWLAVAAVDALAATATTTGGGLHKRTGHRATLRAPRGRGQARAKRGPGSYP